MVWPVLIGAALGAAQQYEQQKQADRQRKVEAAKARYSPWTGVEPGTVQDPSAMKNIGGGAMTGYMMGGAGGAGGEAAAPMPEYDNAQALPLDGSGPLRAAQNPSATPQVHDYSGGLAPGASPWLQMTPQRPAYTPPGR